MAPFDSIMVYAVYPVTFVAAVAVTLMGFRWIDPGTPDKGEEAHLEARLRLLRWLGPLIMAGSAAAFILKIAGVA